MIRGQVRGLIEEMVRFCRIITLTLRCAEFLGR
jgi:hypothetical protein